MTPHSYRLGLKFNEGAQGHILPLVQHHFPSLYAFHFLARLSQPFFPSFTVIGFPHLYPPPVSPHFLSFSCGFPTFISPPSICPLYLSSPFLLYLSISSTYLPLSPLLSSSFLSPPRLFFCHFLLPLISSPLLSCSSLPFSCQPFMLSTFPCRSFLVFLISSRTSLFSFFFSTHILSFFLSSTSLSPLSPLPFFSSRPPLLSQSIGLHCPLFDFSM